MLEPLGQRGSQQNRHPSSLVCHQLNSWFFFPTTFFVCFSAFHCFLFLLSTLPTHSPVFYLWYSSFRSTSQGQNVNPCTVAEVTYIFFLFFCVPAYIPGVHHFWRDFCIWWPFFNPIMEVVTLRLRGWCMLDVFLLLAFICLRHECWDLSSP